MNTATRVITLLLACAAFTSSASAQWDPESGDTGEPPPTETPPQQQQPPPRIEEDVPRELRGERDDERPPSAQPEGGSWFAEHGNEQERPARARRDDGASDHSGVVGRFAIAFLGIPRVPTGPLAMDGAPSEIPTPLIGFRYWLSETIGLQAGVGLGVRSGSRQVGDGPDEATPGGVAFSIQAGLPIAVYHRSHYALLVIPEVGFGLADGQRAADGIDDGDLFTGSRFTLGGRIAAEVQFGFIGIPELSLQASIGAALSLTSASQDLCNVDDDCNTGFKTTVSETTIATTFPDDVEDILGTAIHAFYYF